MTLGSPVARFVVRVFAWLPLAFVVWYFAAPVLLWPVKLAVEVVVGLGLGDLVRAVEQQGSTLTFVTSLRPGAARATGGTVTVDVDLLVYSFGLPLYAALVLAVRDSGRLRRLVLGALAMLPFVTWFAYQFGALVLPTAVPAIAWVVLHRGFLERLRSSN